MPLKPQDLRKVQSNPFVSACTYCKAKEYVPQAEDVPQELRNMKQRMLVALRPIDIDPGVYEKAQYGYRVHTSMMTFSWAVFVTHCETFGTLGGLELLERSEHSWILAKLLLANRIPCHICWIRLFLLTTTLS